MLKLLPALALALIFAQPPIAHATQVPITQVPAQLDENNGEICSKIGVIAGRAIGAHVSGVPITDLLNAGFHPAFREISQAIILDAYSRPLPSSETEKLKIMSDFRNEMELKCRNSQR